MVLSWCPAGQVQGGPGRDTNAQSRYAQKGRVGFLTYFFLFFPVFSSLHVHCWYMAVSRPGWCWQGRAVGHVAAQRCSPFDQPSCPGKLLSLSLPPRHDARGDFGAKQLAAGGGYGQRGQRPLSQGQMLLVWRENELTIPRWSL